MNWEAIGAIGEIAGAAGVIATLVYLAAQIRLNTRTVRASAASEAEEAWAKTNDQLANDGRLGSLILELETGRKSIEDLDQEELAQLTFVVRASMQRLEGMYFMHKNGLLEEEIWRARLQYLRALSSSFAMHILNQPETQVLYSSDFWSFILAEVPDRAR